ncbi:MAG: hypothetical protein IJZ68_08985 [Bacteroidaceae bacterium]|nr:hypothetical protein [Bacteroidaceae bacterium]
MLTGSRGGARSQIGSVNKSTIQGNIGHPGIRWAVSERLRVSTMALSGAYYVTLMWMRDCNAGPYGIRPYGAYTPLLERKV